MLGDPLFPILHCLLILLQLLEIILFIVGSGRSKHMTENLKLLVNFVEKFMGSRGTDLYSITLQETTSPNLICLMAKASSSQSWLWHRRLSRLNFDTINLLLNNDIVTSLLKLKFVKDHLCSSCELGRSKRKYFNAKTTLSSKGRLQLLHLDLCGPMRVESINGKKYVLVIVDDYSRYTWTHFLRSKDETLEVLIDFLRLVQRRLHSQNGIVKRRNRTLVEAARTMISAAKVPLFFSAGAIVTSCFTQNRSLKKLMHVSLWGTLLSQEATEDCENLDKMKEKVDACIFVGYSTQSRGYRVYNKRTRLIVETIYVNFDEFPQMVQANVPLVDEKVTTSLNELDMLFSLMFNEYFNGASLVVLKSFAISTINASDKRQQQNTTPSTLTTVTVNITQLNFQTTPKPTTQAPKITATESINQAAIQADVQAENVMVDEDEFINIFATLTRDHHLKQVIRNPSQPVKTRRQIETDGEMYMFTLNLSRIKPKNIKEAMADHAWIDAMQEQLHQFERLEVFSIWKAFEENTRDLGSFEEETNKTADLQHLSRISTQQLETTSHITRDAVTTHTKTASQDLKTAKTLDIRKSINVHITFFTTGQKIYTRYLTDADDLRVSCYTNAGYLTDADDLKSQTGYLFVLNVGVVDWKSAKQSIFATSSAEAEYIAAFDASKEAVWVRKFISGLSVVLTIK
nr:hypothetical protein [Tanacetum cinerariifolium]